MYFIVENLDEQNWRNLLEFHNHTSVAWRIYLKELTNYFWRKNSNLSFRGKLVLNFRA